MTGNEEDRKKPIVTAHIPLHLPNPRVRKNDWEEMEEEVYERLDADLWAVTDSRIGTQKREHTCRSKNPFSNRQKKF